MIMTTSSDLQRFLEKVEHRDAKIGVLGLGYVGMPLVDALIGSGREVVGYDLSAHVVEGLRNSKSHIDDLTDARIHELLERGLTPTNEASELAKCSTFVICVPTPLSSHGGPDLTAVLDAGRLIAGVLNEGDLVILESTSYPGTTERKLLPVLETSGLKAGADFNLAFSPERIDPGNGTFSLSNTPKIVGGLTPACRNQAVAFYSDIVDEVVPANGLAEAEMAKLLENTYRVVNIALMNEMARFCHDLDIDLWNAIDCAATKPFGFEAFYPGPGVGGHCIPVDPNYLSFHVRSEMGYTFRFVELAQEINNSMPQYVVRRIGDLLNRKRLSLHGAKILLVGITYKPDIADLRETPANGVAKQLLRLGAEIEFLDPYVDSWMVDNMSVPKRTVMDAEGIDCVVFLQHHSGVKPSDLITGARCVLDARGQLRFQDVEIL